MMKVGVFQIFQLNVQQTADELGLHAVYCTLPQGAVLQPIFLFIYFRIQHAKI